MSGTVVGFTGTRKGASELQLKRVEQALYSLGTSWFVHGGSEGADKQAHFIAKMLMVKIRVRPAVNCWWPDADDLTHSKPPLERNKDIVNDVQYMLACPAIFEEELRSGTWATIRYAREIHKPLAIIWPDDTQNLEFCPDSKIPKGCL